MSEKIKCNDKNKKMKLINFFLNYILNKKIKACVKHDLISLFIPFSVYVHHSLASIEIFVTSSMLRVLTSFTATKRFLFFKKEFSV